MLVMDAATNASAADITSVLEVIGAVFTYLIGKIGDLVTVIMQNPLLLIPIGITLGYVVVRFFRMIFRLA